MDRRDFIRISAAMASGAVASELPGMSSALTSGSEPGRSSSASGRRSTYSSEKGRPHSEDIQVRFLGTGAADWKGPDDRGEHRRLSSILVDGSVLVDLTPTSLDMLPKGANPHTILYTHSHSDHYNPKAAMQLGVRTVFVGDTWYEKACKDFSAAAAESGKSAPEVMPLKVGQSVTAQGDSGELIFTALPANHATGIAEEQTLMYLIEKGSVRILYATDTGGIPARAARIVGIDAHVKDGRPITGLIMEATMGMGLKGDEDFRIFTHSSVDTVKRTSDVLLATKRLAAPEGQPVYLTHMARTLHGTQTELDAQLPSPLRAAYDGLEVIFRPGAI